MSILSALVVMTTACAPASLEVHDWALLEETESGLVVLVDVGSSNCNSVDSIAVVETETDVALEARVLVKQSESLFWGGCDADRTIEQHGVELAGPLGDRALLGCDLGDGSIFRAADGDSRADCGEYANP